MLCRPTRLEDSTAASKFHMSSQSTPNTTSSSSSSSSSPTTPIAVGGSPLRSLATVAVATTTAPTLTPNAAASITTAVGNGCCETGRPILTDPLTGQTVCSCQYDVHQQQAQQQQQQLLNYQRFTSGLPLNVYGSPYADQAYLPLTAEQSAFYSPTDNLGTWPYPGSVYYPYDPTLSGYPFANGYGVDLNGSRRKNATRETTSTLKAWLNEHRKNPYPTKGEKIMLAIITKMTLTQVSTWFANARRRLKKENKVTWEPRNRVDDDDDDDGNDDAASDTNERDKEIKTNVNGIQSACDKNKHLRNCDMPRMNGIGGHAKVMDVEPDEEDVEEDMCRNAGPLMNNCHQREFMSSPGSSIMSDSHSSMQSPSLADSPSGGNTLLNGSGGVHIDNQGNPLKPRIWSIVDTATNSHNNSNSFNTNTNYVNNNNGHGYGFPNSTGFPVFRGSSGVTSGGPAVKVSQQLVRNLRLGFTSPYTNHAAWFAGMTVPSSCPPSLPPSVSTSTPPSGYSSSGTSYSSDTTTPSTFTSPSAVAVNQDVGINNILRNSASTACSAPTSGATMTSYPAVATATVTATPTTTMNSAALFGRTYAQTIQNLSNLSKGLNHLMAPQLNSGSFTGPKTSPVQQGAVMTF